MVRDLVKTIALCFLLALLQVPSSWAELPVEPVGSMDAPVNLSGMIDYIEDPERALKYTDIIKGKYNGLWQRNKREHFKAESIDNRYWFRVRINYSQALSEATNHTEPVLVIPNHPSLIQDMTWYLPTPDGKTRAVVTGANQPYTQKDLNSLQHGFAMPPIGGKQVVYGWVDNSSSASPVLMPLYLMTQQQFADSEQSTIAVMLIFYSVMASLLLYNCCLFATLRQPVYGYYLLFLIFTVTTCGFVDASISRYFFPESPGLNNRLVHINAVLQVFLYLAFVWEALDRVRYSHLMRVAFQALFWVGVMSFLNNLLNPFTSFNGIVSQVFPGIVMSATLVAIIVAVRYKVPTAGYLLVAESFMIIAGTAFMLMIQGVLPFSRLATWELHLCYMGEAILLSLALAARTNLAIKEKLSAQALVIDNESRAVEVLEEATAAKSQFLASVSHELRTPLNSIIGFSRVLLDSQTIKSDDREHVEKVLKNGDQLLSIINDVLNLSLIDSNQLSITLRRVNIKSMLDELKVKYELIAEKKNIEFLVDIDASIPSTIEIDDEYLMEVLKQLLDNAFKFTHEGRVTLNVSPFVEPSAHPGEKDHTLLNFCISDTGIGIASDKLTRVFELFSPMNGADSRRYSGTGVGLFIAKAVAEKMGGALSLHSTEGKGTKIDLAVPYHACSDNPLMSPSPDSCLQENPTVENNLNREPIPDLFSGRRVLYVEDNLDNQTLVKVLIEKHGAEVTFAENGKEGIDVVVNAQTPFDLILMDLQMPVMDGYEAAERLKRSGCTVPIIACSASALVEIDSTCTGLFEGYLGKPVDRAKLFSMLDQYLPKRIM